MDPVENTEIIPRDEARRRLKLLIDDSRIKCPNNFKNFIIKLDNPDILLFGFNRYYICELGMLSFDESVKSLKKFIRSFSKIEQANLRIEDDTDCLLFLTPSLISIQWHIAPDNETAIERINNLQQILKNKNLLFGNTMSVKIFGGDFSQQCNIKNCNVTGRGNLKKCGGCNLVYYCSLECQNADWHSHKKTCKLNR